MSDLKLTPIGSIMAKLHQGERRGVEEATRLVAEQSDKNAPRDTDALVNSRQTKVEESGGQVRGEISYGKGLDDPRAVINHEKTDIHHERGGAKYLERAMASELPKVRRAIADGIKKELR